MLCRNIPYCSSDLWIGNKRCTNQTCRSDEFHFLGHQILQNVIEDITQFHLFNESELVILTGVR